MKNFVCQVHGLVDRKVVAQCPGPPWTGSQRGRCAHLWNTSEQFQPRLLAVKTSRGRGGHEDPHPTVSGRRGGAVWAGNDDEWWRRVVLQRCGDTDAEEVNMGAKRRRWGKGVHWGSFYRAGVTPGVSKPHDYANHMFMRL
jgi:hypothetical protein